jgi:glycosyltransferase involved in cell wall biosynthesis
MKILFAHAGAFALAHGGFQTQIEETKAALQRRHVEVEYLRWWDSEQTGDLIHHFETPSVSFLDLAKARGIPVVITHLFTEACNRPLSKIRIQGWIIRIVLGLPGLGMIQNQLKWLTFRRAAQVIVGLQAEKRVVEIMFDVPSDQISIVPLGLNQDFIGAGKPSRSERHLITTGTITDRKRSIELAVMARKAEVPILFVGKPYSLEDPYWKEFEELIDNRFVFHREHVNDRSEMIGLLQASLGFVIFSRCENWCLSAHEAAAVGLPILVPDQPWSRECFGSQASYLDPEDTEKNVLNLKSFYKDLPQKPPSTLKIYSWDEVAERIENVYRSVLLKAS